MLKLDNVAGVQSETITAFALDPKIFAVLCAFIVLIGLAVILVVAEKAVSIHHKMKRNPPLEDTLANLATKPDLDRTERNLKQEIVEGDQRLREGIHELDDRHSEEIRSMRSYNSKTTGEIFDLIRSQNQLTASSISTLSASISKEFSDLNKDIGELRGELRARRNQQPPTA